MTDDIERHGASFTGIAVTRAIAQAAGDDECGAGAASAPRPAAATNRANLNENLAPNSWLVWKARFERGCRSSIAVTSRRSLCLVRSPSRHRRTCRGGFAGTFVRPHRAATTNTFALPGLGQRCHGAFDERLWDRSVEQPSRALQHETRHRGFLTRPPDGVRGGHRWCRCSTRLLEGRQRGYATVSQVDDVVERWPDRQPGVPPTRPCRPAKPLRRTPPHSDEPNAMVDDTRRFDLVLHGFRKAEQHIAAIHLTAGERGCPAGDAGSFARAI